MQLNIKIDANYEEPVTLITTARMTDEVNRIVDFINQSDAVTTIISGIKNGKVELLEQESLFRIYAEEGKVFAKTEYDLYQLRLRLYELEERLDDTLFVRISNSEIVNLKKVKNLDLSFVGTICMELSNGDVSYVSRRYVSKIRLGHDLANCKYLCILSSASEIFVWSGKCDYGKKERDNQKRFNRGSKPEAGSCRTEKRV